MYVDTLQSVTVDSIVSTDSRYGGIFYDRFRVVLWGQCIVWRRDV